MSPKCKPKLVLNTAAFDGSSRRSKKDCQVHLDSELYKESPMWKIWAILAAQEINLWAWYVETIQKYLCKPETIPYRFFKL